MKNHFVLFDLDGTITDSSDGIINSIKYALKKMGKEEHNTPLLKSYVGPSLKDTFVNNYFPKGEEYKLAIDHYREYYATKGIFENKLYQGVPEVLNSIIESGGKVALATAKPTYFAKIILRHFGIYQKFDTIVGSHLGGTRSTKKEIIFEVLDQFGFPNSQNIYMIGDRNYDINGGKQHKLKTIGVEYGYGLRNELYKAQPDFIVETPLKILDCF